MADEEYVDVYEVDYNGKKHTLTVKDFLALRDSGVAAIKPYIDTLERSLKVCTDIHEDYLETAQLQEGLFKAVCQMVTMKWGGVKFPSTGGASRAQSAISRARSAVQGKRIAEIGLTVKAAEDALNVYRDEIEKFVADMGGAAQKTHSDLRVAVGVGFAVLGALGASYLIVGGMTAVQAGAASGAAVKALEGAMREIDSAVRGEKVDVWTSSRAVIIDTFVGAATGAIAGRLDGDACKAFAQAAAKKCVGKLTFITQAQLQTMLQNFIAGAGLTGVVSAVNTAIEQAGDLAKKGKMPGTNDVYNYVEQATIGWISSGVMKGIEVGEEKFLEKAEGLFETKYVPDAVKKLTTATLSSGQNRKIVQETFKSLKDAAGKSGVTGIVTGFTGSDSPDKMADTGIKALEKDTAMQRLIEAEVKNQLKKQKIPVK